MIPNAEILKYFIENDYSEYLHTRYRTDQDINAHSYVKQRLSYLLMCLSDKDTDDLERALIGNPFGYFPELNEWLPDVRL